MPTLAIAGVLLWIGAGALYLSAFLTIAGSDAKLSLAFLALVFGAACHVLSITASVKRARALGRVPLGALLYAPLVVAGAAFVAYNAGAEARELRATPGAVHVYYLAGDTQIRLRDGSGTWRVPIDACPGRRPDEPVSTESGYGFADVTFGWTGEGLPAMRLHVAERRVECFGPAGPPARPYTMRVTFGRPTGEPDEHRTWIELHGDTLVSRFADGRTARSIPSEADWRAFRAGIDSSGVATWQGFFDNLDGVGETAWTVEIEAPNLDVYAGSRAPYPGADGLPQDTLTPAFTRFVQAVEHLVGRPVR